MQLIDDSKNSSDSGLTVIALDDIPANELCEVVVAVGEPEVRKALYNRVKSKNFKFASLVDPSSIISRSCKIGKGSIVYPNTVVSSGVTLGGAVVIGELTFVGMGSSIKERVTVGTQSIVDFGSVVYKDIPDGVIVLGNPARVARRNEDKKVF